MAIITYKNDYFKKAYVVFQDSITLPYLRLLKKGFRHCYILLPLSPNQWLELNPMSNQIQIMLRGFSCPYDYISYLRQDKNLTICEVLIQEAELEPAPLGFFTCVEFAKRSIGIHDFFILTPHQLFKKLSTTL